MSIGTNKFVNGKRPWRRILLTNLVKCPQILFTKITFSFSFSSLVSLVLLFSSLFFFSFFFYLFVFFLKKTCILIHVRLCGWVGDTKIITRPISGNKTTFFGLEANLSFFKSKYFIKKSVWIETNQFKLKPCI